MLNYSKDANGFNASSEANDKQASNIEETPQEGEAMESDTPEPEQIVLTIENCLEHLTGTLQDALKEVGNDDIVEIEGVEMNLVSPEFHLFGSAAAVYFMSLVTERLRQDQAKAKGLHRYVSLFSSDINPDFKPSGDAATDKQTGAAQLTEWANLSGRESSIPSHLNTAVYGLVFLAQKCVQHEMKVRLETRPGLRLAIDAAKAALATIEEELLLRYERERQEGAASEARLEAAAREVNATN